MNKHTPPHPALAVGYRKPLQFDTMLERIENSMRIIANLIVRDGDVYLPLFQRLEREHEIELKRTASIKRALSLCDKNK